MDKKTKELIAWLRDRDHAYGAYDILRAKMNEAADSIAAQAQEIKRLKARQTCYHGILLTDDCDRCAESYGNARPQSP